MKRRRPTSRGPRGGAGRSRLRVSVRGKPARRVRLGRSPVPRPRSGEERAARPRTPADPPVGRAGLDGGVVTSAALLAGLGIVMIYSTTAPLAFGEAVPPHLVRHLVALAAGLAAAGVALRIPLSVWRRLAIPLWAVSAALLAATLVIGVEVNGARRWLALPGLSVRLQAAELAKWTTVLAIAAVLARRGASPAGTRATLAIALPPALLLLGQPDFGSAAILVALAGLLLFAVGTPLTRLALPAGVAVAGAAAYVALRPYALARWTGFLDPWRTARDEGFQLVQSFVAFGRGGTFGVGLGDGRQKLFYLPEAHTDFMLSVVAEELGLVGVLVVLGAFAALAVAGTRIARRARDPFALLLAFGMMASLAVPAAVNGAVVTGLLPTTGFPLPFLSYGGNSLLFSGLAVGLLLRIAAVEAPPAAERVGVAATRAWARS